ncbi:hypothetical protein DICPUDRAFT_57374 [Dictyostelium purpureum]|uniref:MINDY deubiquitinase domain-containing protein n=1 Tax=Dictyostelium purpureum TaxID=5786 RepID=F0ZVP4_DICPU|nr:uncharacterized protein DICPUDRAFT_57374 [Dictyostelium purpureum]EGC31984.1 hypothetical protein DICPUDRAFT_57374 [Dictyostelium purpureum]|eukprot:XP_003291482.1 hypothetical protein DICPUDRAFT_57374 [Dictyostelium purpureum]
MSTLTSSYNSNNIQDDKMSNNPIITTTTTTTTTSPSSSSGVASGSGSIMNSPYINNNNNNNNNNNSNTDINKSINNSNNNNNNKDSNAFTVKSIMYNDKKKNILTQKENGPCPLIAIINVLSLRGEIEINDTPMSYDGLVERIGSHLFESMKNYENTEEQFDYEIKINDSINALPTMISGLNLDIKFTGIRDFDSSCDMSIFKVLSIDLVHGWLVDPQDIELVSIIGDLTYNKLTEKICNSNPIKSSGEDLFSQFKIKQFLADTSSQLSYHGLYELHSKLNEGELVIFFRNNHFNTMLKRNSELYLLVTDEGYINEPIVWERLSQIDGDTEYVLHDFKNFKKEDLYSSFDNQNNGPNNVVVNTDAMTDEELAHYINNQENQPSIDQDFAVALQLQNQENAKAGYRKPKEKKEKKQKEQNNNNNKESKFCKTQ